jgi:ATP-dependent Lhr-like helicase
VILVDGALAVYIARGDRVMTTFLPDAEPDRSKTGRAIARTLVNRAHNDDEPRGLLIEEIDGMPSTQHPLARYLAEGGFVPGALGMQLRNRPQPPTPSPQPPAPSPQPAARRPRRDSVVSSPFARRYYDQAAVDDAERDDEG